MIPASQKSPAKKGRPPRVAARSAVVHAYITGSTGEIVAGSGRKARPPAGGEAGRPTLPFPPSELIQVIKSGLPVQEVEHLRASLDEPMDKVAAWLGISKATFHRRKLGGKLDPGESDRVVRFSRLIGKAIEVLESPENARRWLTSPQRGLGGEIPLNYAGTEVGAREVEDLLGRMEFGVYS